MYIYIYIVTGPEYLPTCGYFFKNRTHPIFHHGNHAHDHTDVSPLQGLFGGPGLLSLQLLQTLDQLWLGVEAPRRIRYQWLVGKTKHIYGDMMRTSWEIYLSSNMTLGLSKHTGFIEFCFNVLPCLHGGNYDQTSDVGKENTMFSPICKTFPTQKMHWWTYVLYWFVLFWAEKARTLTPHLDFEGHLKAELEIGINFWQPSLTFRVLQTNEATDEATENVRRFPKDLGY